MGIKSINLKNFKNIKNSEIIFKSNLSGIYGPNGTGKTAIIEAIDILKNYFEIDKPKIILEELKRKISESMKQGEDFMEISVIFENKIYEYELVVEFNKSINEDIYVSKEEIKFKEKKSRTRFKKLALMKNSKDTIIPEFYLGNGKEMSKIIEKEILGPNKLNQKDLILGINNLNSYFSQLLKYESKIENLKISKKLESFLEHWSKINLIINMTMVVTLKEQALYNIDIAIPLKFHIGKDHGTLVINYKENQNIYSEKIAGLLEQIIIEVSRIFEILIPNSKLILEKEVVGIGEEKKIGIKLYLEKDGNKIPIERESTGIIKLFSIMSALIYYIKDENAIVLIDELDIHIFEYLLAILLQALSENAKGQLIFTGHNLLPLERLKRNSIIISSKTKEDVVYSYLKGTSNTTNLRQKYLKSQSMWSEENIEPLLINIPALNLFVKKLVI